MDPDLENIIRRALGVAKAAGRDHPNLAVELHTLIEETEEMNTSDRGLKPPPLRLAADPNIIRLNSNRFGRSGFGAADNSCSHTFLGNSYGICIAAR